MQARTSPSLVQISKKRRLTGEDAGRALLICTADSAITGKPSALPENVAEYINTTLPFNPADAEVYQCYLALCSYLSHQRALADAHAIRFYGHITSLLKTLETSIAIEKALLFFCSDPTQAEEIYAKHAPFTGFGIEAFIPALYDSAEIMRSGNMHDAENSRISRHAVAVFNFTLTLLEKETSVNLDPLRIDTIPFDEKINAFNDSAETLRAILNNSPMKAEKLAVLDEFFGKINPISDISFSKNSINHAYSTLKNLKIFLTGGEPNFCELLKEESHES